jgi:hypothetical protein
MSKAVDSAADAARVIVTPIGDETVAEMENRAKAALGIVGSDFRNSFVFLGKSKSMADLRATDPNENVPEELGWLRLINIVWHNTGAMFFSALGNGIAHFGERPIRVLGIAAVITFVVWSMTVML